MKKKSKAKPRKTQKATGQKWKVEHRFSYGWDDAGWTSDDEPQRFDSKAEAEEEIRDFIKDQHESFKAGDMDEKYRRSDYRAVPAGGDDDDDDPLDD